MLFFCGIASSSYAAVILQYHRISNEGPASTRTSPAQFFEHLDTIKRLNYRVVSLESLAEDLRNGLPLPDKVAAITFDDAYASVYDVAAPALLKNGWPFTIFASPKDIAKAGEASSFMNWQQLKQLSKQGVLIGNHSLRHSHMIRRLEGETEPQWTQRIRDDVLQAEALIIKHIGKAGRYFAYPYGEYDTALETILKDLDYVAVTQHSGAVANNASLQALPRFPFGGPYGGDDFTTKLTALAIPVALSELEGRNGESLIGWELPPGIRQPALLLAVSDSVWLAKTEGKTLQCFASGQGQIDVKQLTSNSGYRSWRVSLSAAVPVGRSRINCTMAAGEGRFYWYSQLIIRRNDDGSWYYEP